MDYFLRKRLLEILAGKNSVNIKLNLHVLGIKLSKKRTFSLSIVPSVILIWMIYLYLGLL